MSIWESLTMIIATLSNVFNLFVVCRFILTMMVCHTLLLCYCFPYIQLYDVMHRTGTGSIDKGCVFKGFSTHSSLSRWQQVEEDEKKKGICPTQLIKTTSTSSKSHNGSINTNGSAVSKSDGLKDAIIVKPSNDVNTPLSPSQQDETPDPHSLTGTNLDTSEVGVSKDTKGEGKEEADDLNSGRSTPMLPEVSLGEAFGDDHAIKPLNTVSSIGSESNRVDMERRGKIQCSMDCSTSSSASTQTTGEIPDEICDMARDEGEDVLMIAIARLKSLLKQKQKRRRSLEAGLDEEEVERNEDECEGMEEQYEDEEINSTLNGPHEKINSITPKHVGKTSTTRTGLPLVKCDAVKEIGPVDVNIEPEKALPASHHIVEGSEKKLSSDKGVSSDVRSKTNGDNDAEDEVKQPGVISDPDAIDITTARTLNSSTKIDTPPTNVAEVEPLPTVPGPGVAFPSGSDSLREALYHQHPTARQAIQSVKKWWSAIGREKADTRQPQQQNHHTPTTNPSSSSPTSSSAPSSLDVNPNTTHQRRSSSDTIFMIKASIAGAIAGALVSACITTMWKR